MKKIIIISPSKTNRVGGVERFCYLLKDFLERNDFEVRIIGKEDLKKSLIYKIFKNIKGLDLIVLGYLLGKFADKLKPDLVITNGLYGFSTKSKSINVQHGTFVKASERMDKSIFKKIIRKNIWGHFEKLAVNKAQKVVAVSNETKESIKKYYNRNDAEVILNAVEINLFSKKDKITSKKLFNLPLDKKLILFVGRLSYEKSPEILYELAKRFEQENVYFVFTTDRILNWGLENTFFLLNIANSKLPYLYSACDIFVLPSKHEGCAFTLLEAMACEIPFIFTDVGCAKEIYTQYPQLKNFLVENLEIECFYNKIREVLKMDEKEKENLLVLGRRFIEQCCSLDVFGEQYLNLIKKVL